MIMTCVESVVANGVLSKNAGVLEHDWPYGCLPAPVRELLVGPPGRPQRVCPRRSSEMAAPQCLGAIGQF